MKKYVCSLEHSKKLKKLGVKQKSKFYWHILSNSVVLFSYKRHLDDNKIFSAFCVGELGEMLPAKIIIYRKEKQFWGVTGGHRENNGKYFCEYRFPLNVLLNIKYEADTEANARASMVEYLIENKLVEV